MVVDHDMHYWILIANWVDIGARATLSYTITLKPSANIVLKTFGLDLQILFLIFQAYDNLMKAFLERNKVFNLGLFKNISCQGIVKYINAFC